MGRREVHLSDIKSWNECSRKGDAQLGSLLPDQCRCLRGSVHSLPGRTNLRAERATASVMSVEVCCHNSTLDSDDSKAEPPDHTGTSSRTISCKLQDHRFDSIGGSACLCYRKGKLLEMTLKKPAGSKCIIAHTVVLSEFLRRLFFKTVHPLLVPYSTVTPSHPCIIGVASTSSLSVFPLQLSFTLILCERNLN